MRFTGFQHKSSTPAQNKSDWSVPQFCLVDSKFVTQNVFSSPTRNFFYLNPPVSNHNNRVWAGGKKADVKLARPSLSVRSLRSMWWSRMACVLVARDDSTLLTRAIKWILRTTLAVSFPVLLTTALDCCPVDTSSSKTARQHTQLVPRRTGSKPTARFHCQRPVASKFTRLEPLGHVFVLNFSIYFTT